MNQVLSMLPLEIFIKLPHLKVLFASNQWWSDITLVLKVFEELARMNLSEMTTVSGWLSLKTPTRPRDPRDCGVALVAESTTIMPGSILVGDVVICEGCEIGPNCTIFGPTIIGPGSYIGPGAEVRRSLIFSALKLAHRSYLGHSIVGRRVNLGAGFTVAVRNLKRGTVHLKMDDRLFDTKLKMFGAIIADDFYCSVSTTVMPGRILIEPLIQTP